MIPIKFVLIGVTIIAAAGFALYNHFQNNSNNFYSHGSQNSNRYDGNNTPIQRNTTNDR